MEMEDPRLHETAQMWTSEQHNINQGAFVLLVMFIIMGVVLWVILSPVGDLLGIVSVIIGVVMAVPLVFIILYLVYTNTDNKDHWILLLPYNRRLFDMLDARVEAKLSSKGHTIEYIPYSGYPGWGASPLSGVKGGTKAYRLCRPGGDDIEVRFGLQVVTSKNHTTYRFPLEIRNIQMGNIDFARQVQADLMDVLIGVDFLSYRKEH
jgi:energy-coupling factor transporter transmembrane protein EcfT